MSANSVRVEKRPGSAVLANPGPREEKEEGVQLCQSAMCGSVSLAALRELMTPL